MLCVSFVSGSNNGARSFPLSLPLARTTHSTHKFFYEQVFHDTIYFMFAHIKYTFGLVALMHARHRAPPHTHTFVPVHTPSATRYVHRACPVHSITSHSFVGFPRVPQHLHAIDLIDVRMSVIAKSTIDVASVNQFILHIRIGARLARYFPF